MEVGLLDCGLGAPSLGRDKSFWVCGFCHHYKAVIAEGSSDGRGLNLYDW